MAVDCMTAHEYVTKPKRVSAVQWTGDNLDEVRAWLGEGDIPYLYEKHPDDGRLWIMGMDDLFLTDYLVRDERGVVERVSADAFAAAYEAVEEVGA